MPVYVGSLTYTHLKELSAFTSVCGVFDVGCSVVSLGTRPIPLPFSSAGPASGGRVLGVGGGGVVGTT